MKTIPVLMYHHVNPLGNFINVMPEIFESHMRYLSEHGYTTLHTEEFLSIISGNTLPPERPIMITFDDGWLDNWVFAFPILRKYHIKAVIFTITSWIGDYGRRRRSDEGNVSPLPVHRECEKMIRDGHSSEVMLSWDEVREMEASGLIDIQSHTHTHKRWDKLYNNREERMKALKQELNKSKEIIEERLGKQCSALCWPWGIYDDGYIDTAKGAGYRVLFTTEKGTNPVVTDPYRIKRIVIGNISVFNLKKKLFIHSRQWLSRLYLRLF